VSKLKNVIDAKSLVIGVLLTVVVFMSMGADPVPEDPRLEAISKVPLNTIWRAEKKPWTDVRGIPFAIDEQGVWYYHPADQPPKFNWRKR